MDKQPAKKRGKSAEYQNFEDTLRKLLKVPKKDIDEADKKWREEQAEKRKPKDSVK